MIFFKILAKDTLYSAAIGAYVVTFVNMLEKIDCKGTTWYVNGLHFLFEEALVAIYLVLYWHLRHWNRK